MKLVTEAQIDALIKAMVSATVISIMDKKDLTGYSIESTDKYLRFDEFVVPVFYLKKVITVDQAQMPNQVKGYIGQFFNFQIPTGDAQIDNSLWSIDRVPAGLSFSNGILSGKPTAPFNGTVAFTHPMLDKNPLTLNIHIPAVRRRRRELESP